MLIESSSLFLMSVGGSFQQWEKDVFFSAAEEVQESADVYVVSFVLHDSAV